MSLENFYAVTATTAPLQESDGIRDVNLTVHHLGTLPIPSKTVGAADPFILDGYSIFEVPATEAEVYVTVADVTENQNGSHVREAYLSLIFSDAEPVDLKAANAVDKEELTDGDFYGVPVDAGTVSFFDAVAMNNYIDHNEYEEQEVIADLWMDLMDEEEISPEGTALVAYPTEDSEDLIAIAHSGWGDGFYPVVKTVDADGKLLGLHIDLQVVGTFEEDE